MFCVNGDGQRRIIILAGSVCVCVWGKGVHVNCIFCSLVTSMEIQPEVEYFLSTTSTNWESGLPENPDEPISNKLFGMQHSTAPIREKNTFFNATDVQNSYWLNHMIETLWIHHGWMDKWMDSWTDGQMDGLFLKEGQWTGPKTAWEHTVLCICGVMTKHMNRGRMLRKR